MWFIPYLLGGLVTGAVGFVLGQNEAEKQQAKKAKTKGELSAFNATKAKGPGRPKKVDTAAKKATA